MKIYELLEARRNPELNPKVSINSQIAEFGNKFGDVTAFVSFTSIDKLGINPGSKYKTPLGIYAYPLSYVQSRIKTEHSPEHRLPFAGDQPYATLFTVDPKRIIFLSKFSKADLDTLISHMGEVYPDDHSAIDRALAWAKQHANVKTAGGIMWAMTMMFAGMNTSESQNRAAKWNKVFQDLGIDGVVDDDGDGIIHSNERTQAVFFKKPGVIKNEKRIYNKYSPDVLKPKHEKAELRKTAQAVVASKMEKHNGDAIAVVAELIEAPHDQAKLIRDLPKSFIDSISVDAVVNRLFRDDSGLDDLAKVIKFTKYVYGQRWRPGEKAILDAVRGGEDSDIAQNYCIRNMNRVRWPEFEKILLGQDDGYSIVDYAQTIINARWPAAEAQLRLQPRSWKHYCTIFNIEDA